MVWATLASHSSKCMRNNERVKKGEKEYLHHVLTNESPNPQAFWKNVKQVLPRPFSISFTSMGAVSFAENVALIAGVVGC